MGRPGLAGTMARTAVIAGTATAVSGSVRNRQEASAQQAADAQAADQQQAAMQQQAAAQQAAAAQAAQAPPPPPPAGDDMIASLERLGALHSQGVLTDEEFAAAKAKLLG
jgi:multidrug resistance efflux pump